MYYTVILDRDNVQQSKDDHAMVRITPTRKKRFRRNIERIVYDTDKNEWISITTYPDG